MAFMDDFGKKMADFGNAAVKKTKEVAGSAKFEAQLLSEQKVLDALNKKLAKYCYEAMKPVADNADDSTCINITAEMVNVFKDIRSSNERIDSLKSEIQKVKDSV